MSTKVRLVKAMVFPVVMYGCDSWTVKKAERRKLMLLNCGTGEDSRVPWTARRSNQSIVKEISQPWDFFGRNDAKDEIPVLWPPHAKS